jgi:phosphoglycerate kinase
VEVPADSKALDIGPETIASYSEEIQKAATILWNGPMGWFEEPTYSTGTLAIAEQIALQCESGAYAAVGGGDSLAAINLAGVANQISHMSTGGGASLEYLSGMKLPGLVNLIKC